MISRRNALLALGSSVLAGCAGVGSGALAPRGDGRTISAATPAPGASPSPGGSTPLQFGWTKGSGMPQFPTAHNPALPVTALPSPSGTTFTAEQDTQNNYMNVFNGSALDSQHDLSGTDGNGNVVLRVTDGKGNLLSNTLPPVSVFQAGKTNTFNGNSYAYDAPSGTYTLTENSTGHYVKLVVDSSGNYQTTTSQGWTDSGTFAGWNSTSPSSTTRHTMYDAAACAIDKRNLKAILYGILAASLTAVACAAGAVAGAPSIWGTIAGVACMLAALATLAALNEQAQAVLMQMKIDCTPPSPSPSPSGSPKPRPSPTSTAVSGLG